MKYCTGILAVLSVFLMSGCASNQTLKPDPVKEELTILQKQLLELQKLQNETRAKLEESSAAISTLSAKIQSLEERQAVRPVNQQQLGSTAPDKKASATVKKKPAKKTKKKARRQE